MAAQTTNEQALAKANEVMAKKGFTVEMIMQGIAAYFTHKAKLDAELYKAYLDSKQTQADFEQTHGLHKQTIKDMRKYYHLTNRKTSKSQQSESRAQEATPYGVRLWWLQACNCAIGPTQSVKHKTQKNFAQPEFYLVTILRHDYSILCIALL